jgi:hypothetical protein
MRCTIAFSEGVTYANLSRRERRELRIVARHHRLLYVYEDHGDIVISVPVTAEAKRSVRVFGRRLR